MIRHRPGDARKLCVPGVHQHDASNRDVLRASGRGSMEPLLKTVETILGNEPLVFDDVRFLPCQFTQQSFSQNAQTQAFPISDRCPEHLRLMMVSGRATLTISDACVLIGISSLIPTDGDFSSGWTHIE